MVFLGKSMPVWSMLLILIAASSISFAAAPMIRTLVALEGEVVDVTTELTVTLQGFDAAKKDDVSQGDTVATAQIMTVGNGGDSHTAITRGNWIYSVRLDAITGTTPASTRYSVILKVDGVVVDTLYVASDADPTSSEYSVAQFDLGASIPSSSSYVVEVQQA